MTLSDDYIAMQDDPWRDPYLTDEENVSPVRLNRPKPSLLVTEIGKKPTSEMKSQWESDVRNATVDVDLQSMFDSLGLLEKFREFQASHGTAIAKLADKICARDVLKGMWFASDTGTRRELVRFIDRYLHLVMDELAPDVLPFDIINHDWRSIFDTELMPGLLVGYPDRASLDENRCLHGLCCLDIYMPVVISGHGLIDDSSEGKDMEKMCACVRGMWAVQFTRAFIPALYIDDDFNVTLYVFTRGRLLRTVLGSLVDTNKDTLISLITPLAFHLLQTEHFGRFCNWYDEMSSMRLTHRTPVDT
ncbi:hypothetical protein DL89DRAFT_255670 [Linderina pennispora]|uniref:Uncharacterized protein n=1 Tax=Linderina pennispora TaxID=61395 RepID=A0A1Y1WEM6_9FUNG|nr:uncharacterized protein DL89DRAFT_255670 [Linderina pennispora]ORX71967.1 hypothetical protein DL89DRAFT_255670 [Linderina pennispora]